MSQVEEYARSVWFKLGAEWVRYNKDNGRLTCTCNSYGRWLACYHIDELKKVIKGV